MPVRYTFPMEECIFCAIAAKRLPADIVYEDEETLAFLDIHPVNPGHTLVIPKKHVSDLFEIGEADWLAQSGAARRVAHAIERALSPDGVNLMMNNRAPAGQVIFHAHMHVVPRFTGDGYSLWQGESYPEGEKEKTAEAIRDALKEESGY